MQESNISEDDVAALIEECCSEIYEAADEEGPAERTVFSD